MFSESLDDLKAQFRNADYDTILEVTKEEFTGSYRFRDRRNTLQDMVIVKKRLKKVDLDQLKRGIYRLRPRKGDELVVIISREHLNQRISHYLAHLDVCSVRYALSSDPLDWCLSLKRRSRTPLEQLISWFYDR